MSYHSWSHRLQDLLAYDQGLLSDEMDDEMEMHVACCKDCRKGLTMLDECDVYTVMMRTLR